MSDKTTEAKSNIDVANGVVAPKARYFVPSEGGELEGVDVADVTAQVEKLNKKKRKSQEDGDA